MTLTIAGIAVEETVKRSEPFQPWRKFRPDDAGEPHGWIQWKGTKVCMDVHCVCGSLVHVDGEFAYRIRCGDCGQRFETSGFVELRPIAAGDPDPDGPDPEADVIAD